MFGALKLQLAHLRFCAFSKRASMFWSILVTLQSPADDPGATSVSHLQQWHEKPQTVSSNSRRPYKHQRESFERIVTNMHFSGDGTDQRSERI